VTHLGDVVDEQTRTVKVRLELSNAERRFKPGMFVTARVATGATGPPVVMVPKDAVVLMDDGPSVFVEEGEALRARVVEVGQEMDGWIPVRNGLGVGERIATAGTFALKAHLVKAKLGED
jgi:cobalt-zinc-cadmium efflux system membrane fusion protein